MKAIARSLVVIFVALIAVPALAVTQTITAAVQLLATTALILGGTQHPLAPPTDDAPFVNNYFGQAVGHYIVPGTGTTPDSTYAVVYPAEFAPAFGSETFDDSVSTGVGNLGACLGATGGICTVNHSAGVDSPGTNPDPPSAANHFVVFGYSQSAVVAALVKNEMIDNPDTSPALDGTQFVLLSNPMRPNGGILGRGFEGMTIPLIGITFYGPTENSCPTAAPCTPDDTVGNVYPTVDIAQQYDLLGGDAPARLDPLAWANSLAAYALLHGNMPTRTIDGSDPQVVGQGTYGDTDYYMVTAPRLPILMLLTQAGVPDAALALPDAILRVWIEDKYVRDKSPGEHVGFQLSPIGNPVALVGNMLGAIPVGIDDTVQEATGTDLRPLGTANVYRPFGVGGPVYDKSSGDPATDNVGIPTGANTQTAVPPLSEPQTLTVNDNQQQQKPSEPDATKLANDEATVDDDADQPADTDATKPQRPLQLLRDSLKFDPAHRPSAPRPSGDGPLKKLVNALTGQRPKPEETKPADDPKPADAAA